MAEVTVGMHGLVPLKRFKDITKMEELQFKKGKGRQFCSTPVGVLFMAKVIDLKKDLYVTIAGENVMAADKVTSLAGTLWLVNAMVVDGDLI